MILLLRGIINIRSLSDDEDVEVNDYQYCSKCVRESNILLHIIAD
jgi:hypothetical protein